MFLKKAEDPEKEAKKKELLKNIVGNFGGIQEENMALKS